MMKISQNGLNLIKRFEGCYLKAYKCPAGVWTIGWGTTNSDIGITGTEIKSGLRISQETADEWLENSVNAKYAPAVERYNSIYNFSQNEFDALVSFTYNCGSGALNQLVANGNRSIEEISSHFLAYTKAGKQELPGLVRRRNAEKSLFDSPCQSEIIIPSIFDWGLYDSLYEDLHNAYNGDPYELFNHYINCGINEGRIASYVFDIDYYINKYSDVGEAYWNNKACAFYHFVNYGINEGRQASQLFDVNYYGQVNPDVSQVYSENQDKINHFMTHGINEGRLTSREFDVHIYRNSNQDISDKYGDSWKDYFRHYMLWGRSEGRKCV